MDREGLAREIYDRTHLTGEFVLRSGAVSNEYFDKYLFESDPGAAAQRRRSARAARARRTPRRSPGSSSAASRSPRCCRRSPASRRCFVRKEAKTYGTCRLAEGGEVDGRRLTVVEDVVTSGGQVIMSCRGPPRARRDRRARGVRHRPPRRRAPAPTRRRRHRRPRRSSRMDELKQAGERSLHEHVSLEVSLRHRSDTCSGGGAVQPRQGGVRGGSKSAGICSPSIAANADSTQRWIAGQRPGQVVAGEEADRAGLERVAAELAAEHAAVEHQRVQREAGRSRGAGRRAPRSARPARPRCRSPRTPLSPRPPTASSRRRPSRPGTATRPESARWVSRISPFSLPTTAATATFGVT